MTDIVFTSDEEVEAFQPEDKSIDIIGYVECIEGLKTLKTASGHVLKFVVHNASKSRIRVLVWGTALATHYEQSIKINSIVEITGGNLKTANTHFRLPNDKTSTLEFNVQSHSLLTVHGQYDSSDHRVVNETYELIELDDVMLFNGNIGVNNTKEACDGEEDQVIVLIILRF
ncbi:hypothetical protein HCN44_010407 [Aphidius gifuensis]|uniref:Replication protein A OB domain-containing protein n=1 Tax=Aphidius gifuensis TaxID=684658 RepID=A0A834Y5D2_APHGI|nr:hypothetical protein HCN44_010407 [Aphidius gifuensis]